MIKLRDIAKVYRAGSVTTWVLRKINLDVRQGEFVSLMGPSGAGKSTLLNIIGMLDDPSEGEFFFADEPVHNLSEKKRAALFKASIGIIFQNYHLIDDLTVYENLETPLLYKKVASAERKSIICDTLDRFQIVGKKDLFPSQLSGGQQQLVGVARAIVSAPRLLLADEPTGNLHSGQGREIMELFRKLNEDGTTIIQATHSESNASYAKRVIHLKDGWIASDGPDVPQAGMDRPVEQT